LLGEQLEERPSLSRESPEVGDTDDVKDMLKGTNLCDDGMLLEKY
jgi:hypothetical protein